MTRITRRRVSFASIRGCIGLLTFCVVMAAQGERGYGQAQPLKFFKNYFVTGDFAVAGVGLEGRGVNGIATGAINVSGVPEKADVLAAFLYWQVVSGSGPDAGAENVTFNGYPLSLPSNAPVPTGGGLLSVVGDPFGTSPCWSSGGGTGSSGGSKRTFTYRADVLRFLPVGPDGKFVVNGAHAIQLPDQGNSNNTPRALGASLVVVYRHPDPATSLNAIVIYNGSYTMNNATRSLTQVIAGFYDPADAPGKITHIVGSGQANKSERLVIPGLAPEFGAFGAFQGASWDNVTRYTSGISTSSLTTTVDQQGVGSGDCLTWSAIIYRTKVNDEDGDGLLDKWESSATPLVDPNGDPLPNLSLMGAKPRRKDIFIEIGAMTSNGASLTYGGVSKLDHSHLPTYAAIKMVGDAFRYAPVKNPDGSEGIDLHVDVGDNHQEPSDGYIVPTDQGTRGGELVDEMETVCLPNLAKPWVCQFSAYPGNGGVYPGTVGWKSGFRFFRDMPLGLTDDQCEANESDGNPQTTCERIFDRNRKHMFRYVLFAHALGVPKEDCLVDGFPDANCQATNPSFHVPVTNTGVGDFGGGDAMVTLGGFDDAAGRPVGSDFMQASTLMHELGHSFFLRHGGASGQPNCKPNYQSVMNYLFQLRGLKDDANTSRVNFSGQILPGIDETLLSDPGGLGVDPRTNQAPPYRTGWYAPKASGIVGTPATQHCDGSELSQAEKDALANGGGLVRVDSPTVAATQGDIDWTKSSAQPAVGGQDINLDGVKSILNRGHNDWLNIRLNQVGARRNVGGWFWVFDELTNDYLAFMGTLSLDVGRADLGRADLGRADLGRADLGAGDLGRGDTGFGDLGRADLGRADLGRADLGRADLGRADLGRADLGAGLETPGELTPVIATASGGSPPEELSARVLGLGVISGDNCEALGRAVCHRIRLDWKRSNLASETRYVIYRASGSDGPEQIDEVASETGQASYFYVDMEELPNGPFTYFVLAVFSPTSSAASDVTITARNDRPVAGNDSYATTLNVALVVPTLGVIGNDTDIDSPSLKATLVTAPQFGTLSLNANGSFTYTPNAGYAGPDGFTYTANDVDPTRSSNVATVSITVTVNHAPAGTNNTVTTPKNTPYVFARSAFGFSDPNDTPPHAFFKVKIATLPLSNIGTLTLNGVAIAAGTFVLATDLDAGKLKFVPKQNKTGTASFTFQVQDNGGTTGGGVDLDPTPNTLQVQVGP